MIMVERQRKNIQSFLGMRFRNTSKQSTLEEVGAMLHLEMVSEAHFFLNIFTIVKVSAFLIDKTTLRTGYSIKHGRFWVAVVEPIRK